MLPPPVPLALSKPVSLMLWDLSLGSGRGDGQARPLQQCEADTGHPEAPQRRQQPHSSSVCHGFTPQVRTCRRSGGCRANWLYLVLTPGGPSPAACRRLSVAALPPTPGR